ncbi:hypothetical protein [Polaribacter ponticola]|uniref:Uncharacterized protein n=1 Tax=Polaribacter ponticola TaxID=2978475 RepID=A0ABT5S9S5_9FLAO|nr:hypothetical protein [Polaribacter sp. MSW5]MDD7914236.1 hypothetical protein [Polaribacter sp. MSW5]
MLPTSIEIIHDLENHEHIVCSSQNDHHIHIEDLDCNEFHKQITFFSLDFPANLDVIPKRFYTSLFIDKPQIEKEIYQSIKTTRGPPHFTV